MVKKRAAISSSPKSLIAQRLECAELIERVKIHALHVLGKRILFGGGVAALTHDAGHRRRFGHAFLFDQQLEGAVAPAACGNLEHPRLDTLRVQYGPHIEALQQTAMRDVFGELLDGKAAFHAPDIGLGQEELVKRNILRPAQNELWL